MIISGKGDKFTMNLSLSIESDHYVVAFGSVSHHRVALEIEPEF